MRRFIIEALVDAVILVAVILVLSVPSVPQPFPWGDGSASIIGFRGAGAIAVIWFAVALVLVNRFGR
jgi:hypothetical protein